MNLARAFGSHLVYRLTLTYRHACLKELWAHRDGFGMRMGDPSLPIRNYRIDYLNWDMQRRIYCKRYNHRRRNFSNQLVPISHSWHYSHTVE